jgi:hypothetical protein
MHGHLVGPVVRRGVVQRGEAVAQIAHRRRQFSYAAYRLARIVSPPVGGHLTIFNTDSSAGSL